MNLTQLLCLGAGLAVATPLTRICAPEDVLRHTSRLARGLLRRPRAWNAPSAERWLMRLSRVVPGSNCLDRAVVLRCVGAWHGAAGRVVIGFRSRGASRGFEGHAWIEWEDGGRSFVHDADGYTPVHREGS